MPVKTVKKTVKRGQVRPKKSTMERSGAILRGVMDHVSRLSSHAEIVRYVSEKWGLQSRQAENYIAKARQELRESTGLTETEHRAASRMRWQEYIDRARKAGNLQAEAKALQAIDKLFIPEKVGRGSVAGSPLTLDSLNVETVGVDALGMIAKAECSDPGLMIAALEQGFSDDLEECLGTVLKARRDNDILFMLDYGERMEKLRRGFSDPVTLPEQ